MSNTLRSPGSAIKLPSWALRLAETRAIAELYAYAWCYPLMHCAQRGDGHPVLVLPGFLASGSSTFPLRHILKRLGYQGHRWKLGRNMGPVQIALDQVMDRLQELRQRYDQPVSVVGWSLGGIYARELAWQAPDDVRQVITLGTPFHAHEASTAAWLYKSINAYHGQDIEDQVLARAAKPPPVPSTSIYSRGDGVVPWQCSLDSPGPHTENIRVHGSHCGLGHNPLALWAIFDRLAQPDGAWQAFERVRWMGLSYPVADTPDTV
ncbi:MAG: esterase/lipase family protein [Gammaproteobacteria bacterium]